MSKFHAGYTITMKDIVREGNPILRQRTQEVNVPLSKEDQETLICMMNFLKNSQDPVLSKKYQLRAGVGLSANQIGLNKRMFTAYFVDEEGTATRICPRQSENHQPFHYDGLFAARGRLSLGRPGGKGVCPPI